MTIPQTRPGPTPGRATRLVIAEDDQELRSILAQKFRSAGYLVTEAETGTALVDFLIVQGGLDAIDGIISDIRMPGISGLDILAYLNARGNTKPFVLITGFGNWSVKHEAEILGAMTLVEKPVDVDVLLEYFKQVLPARKPSAPAG